MLSDIQIQKKIKSLSNKLNAGMFDDVIDEASTLLKKNKHQITKLTILSGIIIIFLKFLSDTTEVN